ncbi:unnamed protein product, partial [Ixodes hexagonus]
RAPWDNQHSPKGCSLFAGAWMRPLSRRCDVVAKTSVAGNPVANIITINSGHVVVVVQLREPLRNHRTGEEEPIVAVALAKPTTVRTRKTISQEPSTNNHIRGVDLQNDEDLGCIPKPLRFLEEAAGRTARHFARDDQAAEYSLACLRVGFAAGVRERGAGRSLAPRSRCARSIPRGD